MAATSRLSSPVSFSNDGSEVSGRGMTSRLTDWCWIPLRRRASRIRRLILFRFTAFPCFRPTSTACENRSARFQRIASNEPERRLPPERRESISVRFFRLAVRGRLFLTGNRDRQSLAAFCATTREDLAAVLGRHAGAKAVVIQPLAVRWLKCSFHLSLPAVLRAG